jgi:hypothetical protein
MISLRYSISDLCGDLQAEGIDESHLLEAIEPARRAGMPRLHLGVEQQEAAVRFHPA